MFVSYSHLLPPPVTTLKRHFRAVQLFFPLLRFLYSYPTQQECKLPGMPIFVVVLAGKLRAHSVFERCELWDPFGRANARYEQTEQ